MITCLGEVGDGWVAAFFSFILIAVFPSVILIVVFLLNYFYFCVSFHLFLSLCLVGSV